MQEQLDTNATWGRVLVAEDEDDLRELLSERLIAHGLEVVSCSDGAELLERLDDIFGEDGSRDLDAVITDIRMPGLTGLEILEGIEVFSRTCPVFIVTAYHDPETRATAEEYGAAGFFEKPVDVERLVDAVAASVGKRGPKPGG